MLVRGLRWTILVDDGSQITPKMLEQWTCSSGAELDFTRPGKPTDEIIKSFNGRLRQERLNGTGSCPWWMPERKSKLER